MIASSKPGGRGCRHSWRYSACVPVNDHSPSIIMQIFFDRRNNSYMRLTLNWIVPLALAVSLTACGGSKTAEEKPASAAPAASAPAAAPIDQATVGEVTGTVAFDGQAP